MERDFNAVDFLFAHREIGWSALALWLVVSLCLITRLWILRRGDPVVGRLVWSIILLLPLLGWLFYAAFYRAPERLSSGGHAEYGQGATGGDYAGGGPPGT